MNVGETRTYTHKNLSFVITPTKTIIQTPLQTFFLKSQNNLIQSRIIREQVENRSIRTINDVCGYFYNESGEQVVFMIPTRMEWHG